MIETKTGNLFSSKAQTLVNTVNCVGIMGAGIALDFKKKFPDMYKDYVQRCERKLVKLGEPYLFRSLIPPCILNFPTKDHWRSVSRLEDIVKGLEYLQKHFKEWGITSLAVPPLGCGQGQLEWRIVGPTLYRYLKELDIPIELYAPFGTPNEELQSFFLEQDLNCVLPKTAPYRIDPSWVAIVDILNYIESQPYHRAVGRTIFQKIAYFATESGIPTGLQFQRGSFGPFSKELKKNITALVNNGLIREEQLNRMFAIHTGRTFKDALPAYQKEIAEWHPIINRVADLFMRIDTKQAEIAATVHFAAKELKEKMDEAPFEKEVLASVMEWKQKHKPPLDKEEVAITIRNLNMLKWIDAQFNDDLLLTENEFADVY